MSELRNQIVVLFTLIALLGCDSQPSSRVVTEMRNITNDSVLTSLPGVLAVGSANSNVLVESYQIPIMDISISQDDAILEANYTDVVYLCRSEAESDCYIDLVAGFNQNILPEDFESVGMVKEGSYTSMQLGTCTDDSYTALIKAKVDVQGEVWYTQSGNPVLVRSGEYSATQIEIDGCTHYSVFSKPYVVGKRTSYLNLYFDLEKIARALLIDNFPDEQNSDCNWNPETDGLLINPMALCIDLPEIFALDKSESLPKLNRYQWNYSDEPSESSLFGLFLDVDDQPVGAFHRPNYTDSFGGTSRNYLIKSASYNAGKLVVTDFSGPGENSVLVVGDNTLPDFPYWTTGSNIQVLTNSGFSSGYTLTSDLLPEP